MRKNLARLLCAALVLAVFGVAPLLAGDGEDHEGESKCGHEAQGCLNYMASKLKDRGWVGVDMNYEKGKNPSVRKVFPDTPAQRAGVQIGDVLLAINGVELSEENHEKLAEMEGEMKPGATFDFTIAQSSKEKVVSLTLEQMPPEAIAAMVGRHMIEGHTTVEIAAN